MSGPRSPAPGPQQKAPPAHLFEAIGSYVKAMMVGIFWRQHGIQKQPTWGEHLHLCFFSKVSIFATGVQCFNHSRASRLGHRVNQIFGSWNPHFVIHLTSVNETSEEDCLGIHLSRGLALPSSQLDVIVDLIWTTCITWCFWCGWDPDSKKDTRKIHFNFHQFTQNLLLFIP